MKKKLFCIIILCMFLLPLIGVSAETYKNYDPNGVVSCGKKLIENIPTMVTKTVKIAYTIIQVAVPILLVVMGSLDLFKGLSAQKEDDIKKGQQMFVKRLVAAALVFFVFAIVKIIISFAADNSSSRILKCTECFLEGKCDK